MPRFTVRLTSRGGADRIDGVRNGVLHARVTEPPVAGAANQALLRLLAHELGVPRRAVRLVTGEAGRAKLVEVDGLDAAMLAARWPGLDIRRHRPMPPAGPDSR